MDGWCKDFPTSTDKDPMQSFHTNISAATEVAPPLNDSKTCNKDEEESNDDDNDDNNDGDSKHSRDQNRSETSNLARTLVGRLACTNGLLTNPMSYAYNSRQADAQITQGWVDVTNAHWASFTYVTSFGHTAFISSGAFQILEWQAKWHQLVEWHYELGLAFEYGEAMVEQKVELEKLDQQKKEIMDHVSSKCWKFWMGQVDFTPQVGGILWTMPGLAIRGEKMTGQESLPTLPTFGSYPGGLGRTPTQCGSQASPVTLQSSWSTVSEV